MKTRLPVRKAILQRKTYEAPAEGRLNKMRLDFNENTTGCGPAVLRALRKLTPQQLAMYPEYAKPTRRIAAYFGVSEHELLLTNGGDDALRVFFDAFVEPHNSILICEPTFPMYRYYAEIAGARVETLRYGAEMEFPLDDFVSALRKQPVVIFIANPNNPTGTLLPLAAIKQILLAAPKTVVVIDEAYAEFSGVTVEPHRTLTLAPQRLRLADEVTVLEPYVVRAESNSLRTAREADLVGILDDLTARNERVAAEERDLQATKDQLTSGTDQTDTALAAARSRVDTLGILTGTVAAIGGTPATRSVCLAIVVPSARSAPLLMGETACDPSRNAMSTRSESRSGIASTLPLYGIWVMSRLNCFFNNSMKM